MSSVCYKYVSLIWLINKAVWDQRPGRTELDGMSKDIEKKMTESSEGVTCQVITGKPPPCENTQSSRNDLI